MNEESTVKSTNWLKQNLADIVPKAAFTDKVLMVDSVSKLISTKNPDRPRAASALLHLLEAGYCSPGSIFSMIETGLLHTENIESSSKTSLIDALITLTLHDANTSLEINDRVTRDSAGKLALSVLEREINTKADISQLINTINLIRILGYRPALAAIDSIGQNSSDEELVALARKTHNFLRNSLDSLWLNTCTDYTSSLKQRNEHIVDSIFNYSLNEYECVQALFNATKDSPIENNDDPRVDIIESLLSKNSNYEIVRLASAYAVLKVSNTNCKLVKQAIDTVTDIGINGVDSNLSTQAASMLESFELKFPDHSKQIEQSRKRANIEFLKKFKL